MRRLAVFLTSVLLAAALLPYFAVGRDTAAMRCGAACPLRAAGKAGLACCPVEDAPSDGCAMRSCSGDAGQALVPISPWPPVSLEQIGVSPGSSHRALESRSSVWPRSFSPKPPDHVPLRLA